jgi:hypothetical protein
MKNIIFLLLISFVVLSCTCKKKTAEENKKNTTRTVDSCPEGFACRLEVVPNHTMVIKTDGTGAVYFELEALKGTTVYRYEISQNQDQKYMDGGYREEIIFELPSDTADLNLSDTDLQQVKLIFGVWCYCKGKAGNYTITKGNFSKKGNTFSVDFPAVVADQKMSVARFEASPTQSIGTSKGEE